MSTRRMATDRGPVCFDHGAQYFTARDPAFREQVQGWQQAGYAARWPAAGDEAWVGVPGMNAPVQQLAEPLDVRWNVQVTALVETAGGWALMADDSQGEFDAAMIAIPAEQAAVLLAPHEAEFAGLAESTASAPCWTLMAAFTERLPISADVLRGHPVVDWAARNSAKPGRVGLESWVVHGNADWSRRHLEHMPADIVPLLLSALADAAGAALPDACAAAAHRWRYAKSGRAGKGHLWASEQKLGVCGDWLLGPRVECAWLSGSSLAEAVIGCRPRLAN